jgi:hypothetical protein
MKRWLVALTIILALGFSSTASAQENVQVSVGLKAWLAEWTETFGGEDIESDLALLIGPTVGVRYANIFGGITYMFGSFEFPDFDAELDRKDLDLVAGYYVHPRVGVLVGYKDIDISGDLDATLKGPVVGVNFNVPIGESRFVIFGNVSYLFLKWEDEFDFEEDQPGPSIEVAGAYAFEAVPINLTAGYKFQSFEGEDTDITDEFSGLTLGANYTFQ